MVHNLTNRDPWRVQGEAYTREIKTSAPVHPLLATVPSRKTKPAA